MISNAKKYEWKRRGATYLELWFGGRFIVKVINGSEYVVRAVTDWGAGDTPPGSGSDLYETARSIQIGGKWMPHQTGHQRILLRYVFTGGAPGTNGPFGFGFELVPSANSAEIFTLDFSEVPPARDLEHTIEHYGGWRDFARYLARFELGGPGYCYEGVTVEGVEGVASVLISLILKGEFAQRWVEALVQIPDAGLASLMNHNDSFLLDQSLNTLRSLWKLLWERDAESETLARLIEEMIRDGEFSIDRLEDRILLWIERLDLDAAACAADWERRAGPYRESVNALGNEWCRRNPASGPFGAMGRGMLAQAICRFAEEHVLEHGSLPSGKHEVQHGGRNRKTIDFDRLRIQAKKKTES